MRLFFALPLPGEAKEALRQPLEEARKAGGDGVGFTRIEQLHFTLAFLGEQPAADEALAAGEALTQTAAFEIAISASGAFPSSARPRVLWLGVSAGAAELVAVAERLGGGLRGRRFALGEGEFPPPPTFGRGRPPGGRSARAAAAVGRAPQACPW